MSETRSNDRSLPGSEQLREELKRVDRGLRLRKLLRSTVYTLIVTAAVAVLIAVFFMPVMRIYGSSMSPTLSKGEIVVSVKYAEISQNDTVGFYYGNKLLIKRCIAVAGQTVNIDTDGNVYVDGKLIKEPYVTSKALGQTDIDLPCKVPEHSIFVMGDNRETSIDSRNSSVGFIDLDDVAGKILFRVWPLKRFGAV